MESETLRNLLETIAAGDASVEEGLAKLRAWPFESFDFATVDHHRTLRWGFPEVIFCEGKTPEQVGLIAAKLGEQSKQVLGTRCTLQQFEAAQKFLPGLCYHEVARCLWLDKEPNRKRLHGVILIAAGTSDLQVLEEAALTLDLMGHQTERIVDVGVAGLHRLLPHIATMQKANVIVVVAGMEGALASVVGGVTSAPVIAVPTSVGYGASFGGVAALLSMLNSCASGVATMNIDNGYGAGHMAALINAKIQHKS